LVDGRPCPGKFVFPEEATSIEFTSNLPFGLILRYEPLIDLPDDLNLIVRSWDQYDPIRLEALPLPTF
jgi:hypothetical protein